MLPILPAPVYPFHSTDGTQAPTTRQGSLDVSQAGERTTVAQAAPAMRASDRSHATGTVRLADLNARRGAAHRARAFHGVSVHTAHARRTSTGNTQIAQLYRGH
nr:hypothetical protein [Burkholderia sp. AU30280]